MREANRRFAVAVTAGDTTAAQVADDELHRIPVAALGNHALADVLDHFGPVVRRAERLRFSSDGEKSVAAHERMIELLAARDGVQASAVAFDIWHSLLDDGSGLDDVSGTDDGSGGPVSE
jgi:DNA-binding GntR family transcriptional regulator